jgi:hypothetical protein
MSAVSTIARIWHEYKAARARKARCRKYGVRAAHTVEDSLELPKGAVETPQVRVFDPSPPGTAWTSRMVLPAPVLPPYHPFTPLRLTPKEIEELCAMGKRVASPIPTIWGPL